MQAAHREEGVYIFTLESFREIRRSGPVFLVQQFPDLGEQLGTARRHRVVVRIGASAPQGPFVEPYQVVGNTTINGGSKVAVAQRKGFLETGGRLVIFHDQPLGTSEYGYDGAGGGQQESLR